MSTTTKIRVILKESRLVEGREFKYYRVDIQNMLTHSLYTEKSHFEMLK